MTNAIYLAIWVFMGTTGEWVHGGDLPDPMTNVRMPSMEECLKAKPIVMGAAAKGLLRLPTGGLDIHLECITVKEVGV